MTKFEPEIAYRILKARQQRYYQKGMNRIFEKAQLWVNAQLTPWAEEWFEREINREYDSGNAMWPILDYLRTRIEEEQHDAV